MAGDEGPKHRSFRKLLWLLLASVLAYLLASWHFGIRVQEQLQDMLRKEAPKPESYGLKVEGISLDEWYLFSNRRHGKAHFTFNKELKSIEFEVSGNGLWNNTIVEVEGWELLKSGVRDLFRQSLEQKSEDELRAKCAAGDKGACRELIRF